MDSRIFVETSAFRKGFPGLTALPEFSREWFWGSKELSHHPLSNTYCFLSGFLFAIFRMYRKSGYAKIFVSTNKNVPGFSGCLMKSGPSPEVFSDHFLSTFPCVWSPFFDFSGRFSGIFRMFRIFQGGFLWFFDLRYVFLLHRPWKKTNTRRPNKKTWPFLRQLQCHKNKPAAIFTIHHFRFFNLPNATLKKSSNLRKTKILNYFLSLPTLSVVGFPPLFLRPFLWNFVVGVPKIRS